MPKKLWPGYTYELFENRVGSLGKGRIRGSAVEIEAFRSKHKDDLPVSETPIKAILGKFWGTFESILFVAKANHDQLNLMTKLGNVWIVYRYLMALVFFVGLVLFSGGANPNLNIFKIISIFGIWLIFESAFLRASLSLFKYGRIESDLGISSRIINFASYLYSWMEILTLIFILLFWKMYDAHQLVDLKQFFALAFAIFTFFVIGIPFSYLITIKSREHIDLKFVVPTILRLLMITTPVFEKFHLKFDLISTILSFSPLNLPFLFLTELPYDKTRICISYIAFCAIGYISLKISADIKKKKWKILKNEY